MYAQEINKKICNKSTAEKWWKWLWKLQFYLWVEAKCGSKCRAQMYVNIRLMGEFMMENTATISTNSSTKIHVSTLYKFYSTFAKSQNSLFIFFVSLFLHHFYFHHSTFFVVVRRPSYILFQHECFAVFTFFFFGRVARVHIWWWCRANLQSFPWRRSYLKWSWHQFPARKLWIVDINWLE